MQRARRRDRGRAASADARPRPSRRWSTANSSRQLLQLVSERQSRRERLAVKVGERFLLVQAEDIIYASLADESITVVTSQLTGHVELPARSTSCRRGSTRASSGACTARTW